MRTSLNLQHTHKYKVLMSSVDPKLMGGPPTHLYLLENGLAHRVNLCTFSYSRKSDNETLLQKGFGRFINLLGFIIKMQKHRPDAVHHNSAFDVNSILRDAPLALCARLFRKPLLVKIHGSHPESFKKSGIIVEVLKNILLKNVACFGVLSQKERDQFEETWPFLKGRVLVVKNIIKSEFLSITRLESHRPTVLFISRFIKKKGVLELLDAIPSVLQEIPQAQFVFVGSGEAENEFERRIHEKGLDENIVKIPQISNEEATQYYSSAWALVFPTQFPEGMPMVVAEAMAAGVPIITSRTRFSLSYMTEGEHCLYVDPYDPSSIAHEIILLLKSPGLREKMSRQNKILAEHFTADKVAGEFVSLYEKLAQ